MSKKTRRVKIPEDLDFIPGANESDLFLAYDITDPAARERIAQAAVDTMRDYEHARTRQTEVEREVGSRALQSSEVKADKKKGPKPANKGVIIPPASDTLSNIEKITDEMVDKILWRKRVQYLAPKEGRIEGSAD